MENLSTKRSKKPLYIIAGVVTALIVVSIAVAIALGGDTDRSQNTTGSSTGGETRDVATNEEVQEGLEAIESSMKQSADDQKNAKEAIEDDKKQVKVGS